MLEWYCIGGKSYGSATYGQGSSIVAFGYMYCSGNEESLFDCNRNIFSVVTGYCKSHSYDVGLKCERMLLYYCTLLMLYN